MSRRLLSLVLSGLWLGGCAGSGPGWPSSDGRTTDLADAGIDGARTDTAPIDSRTADGATRDAAVRDAVARDVIVADQGPCGSWQNWGCEPDESLRCIANCELITPTRVMSCNAAGNCICGAGIEPCGQFALGDRPCDTCRNALEGGCCSGL